MQINKYKFSPDTLLQNLCNFLIDKNFSIYKIGLFNKV